MVMGMSDPMIELVDYLNNKRNGHVDIFYIPPYQRPYEWTWGKNERSGAAYKLYKDIETGSITQMGIILLHRDQDREQVNVIDGQQRLITFSLFIKALLILKEDYIQNDANLGKDAVQRLNTCLYQLDNNLEPTHNLRLQLSAVNSFEDAKSFRDIIQGDGGPKPNPKSSYEKVYKGVYESLKDLTDDEISRFTKNLIKTKIWALEVEDKKLAWEVFQTLNGTGKPLDAADFIKGQLFDELSKLPSSEASEEEETVLAFKNKWESFVTCLKGTHLKVKKSKAGNAADELLQFYFRVSTSMAEKVGEDIVTSFAYENWKLIVDPEVVFANFNAIETFFKIVGHGDVADLVHQELTPISKICLWILRNSKPEENFKFYMPIFTFWQLNPEPDVLECFLKGMIAYWVACNIHLKERKFKSERQKEALIRIIDGIYKKNIVEFPINTQDNYNSPLPSLANENEITELLLSCYRYAKPPKEEKEQIQDLSDIKTLLRIYGFLILLDREVSKDVISALEEYKEADHIVPQSEFKTYAAYESEKNIGNCIGNLTLLTPPLNGKDKGEKADPTTIINTYRASINPDARKVADNIQQNQSLRHPSEDGFLWWWNQSDIQKRINAISGEVAQWCKDAIDKADKIILSSAQRKRIEETKGGKAFHIFPLAPLPWEECWTDRNIVYFEFNIDEEEKINRSVSDLTEAFLAIVGILNMRYDLSRYVGTISVLSLDQNDDKYQQVEGNDSLWIDTDYNNKDKRRCFQKLINACNMQEDDLILYTV